MESAEYVSRRRLHRRTEGSVRLLLGSQPATATTVAIVSTVWRCSVQHHEPCLSHRVYCMAAQYRIASHRCQPGRPLPPAAALPSNPASYTCRYSTMSCISVCSSIAAEEGKLWRHTHTSHSKDRVLQQRTNGPTARLGQAAGPSVKFFPVTQSSGTAG